MALKDVQPDDFFLRECDGLARYVYRIVRDTADAQDVVQEAFLRFYRLRATEERRGSDRGLLYRLARNLAIDTLRERNRVGLLSIDVVSMPSGSPEDVLVVKEQRELCQQALSLLSQREQECLSLRYAGLSYADIASVLNLNPHSVGQVLARALQTFKRRYAELQTTQTQIEKARSAGRW
jgi:RNA polymerase sigma factor (sigma-70 family)